ncbi:hypothetical protein [Nesterenkonia ebinurensis]|uniref:hypothetical protein n=1 Tax=Nesterenkonia ebinurensis TaxID=2608252 RepID=UPI00123D3A0A|nr:hypothetical protein [Nesterenkonia ebinurensis]
MKRVVTVGTAALVCGVVLFIALSAGDLLPHPWQLGLAVCLVLVLAAFTVTATVLNFDELTTQVHWFSPDPVEPDPVFGAADPRLRRIRRMLHGTDDAYFRAELHRSLTLLATERAAAHGVDTEDPEALRAALGPQLADYLAAGPPHRATARTLSDVIQRIENL